MVVVVLGLQDCTNATSFHRLKNSNGEFEKAPSNATNGAASTAQPSELGASAEENATALDLESAPQLTSTSSWEFGNPGPKRPLLD